jgi:hypothetical protein
VSVVVTPSAREAFTTRELTTAYKYFEERGPQYVNAETGRGFPLRPGRTFAPTRPGSLSGFRPFVLNRNICNFLWYGGLRGVRAKVLGRLGWRLQAPFKSVCSILPIARRLKAGVSYGVSRTL